jgi:hypothetical protein
MMKVLLIVCLVLGVGGAVYFGQRQVRDDGDEISAGGSDDHGSRLGPGDDELETGDKLVAGTYELTVEDGGIVQTQDGEVVWATMTDDAVRLVMQPDCNLVAYTERGAVAWESATAGAGSSCTLRMQKDDGNVVVLAPGNRPVWSKP